MAYTTILHGTGSQNLSTASGDTVVSTATMHNTTGINLTSGGVFSDVFTAPNTTNSVTGVAFYITSRGSGGNFVVTLQEYNGSSWVDKSSDSIAQSSLPTGYWYFQKFTTPYTYTTTTAGYYRIKFNGSGVSSYSAVCASSGGTLPYALVCDDRAYTVNGAVGDVFIAGDNGASYTATVDTTGINFGSSTADGANGYATPRYHANGLQLSYNTWITPSLTTSSSLSVAGSIEFALFSGFNQTTALPPAYTFTLTYNQNGTSGKAGTFLATNTTGTNVMYFNLTGTPPDYTYTQYTSGVGTAVSPLVTTQNVANAGLTRPWQVGDEIMIGSTSGNTETETRFIKTVVADNQFTLSTTSGGAEAGLTYTHLANAWILNVTRNIIITTNNSAQAWYMYDTTIRTVDGTQTIVGVRIENIGLTTPSQKQGWYWNASSGNNYSRMDKCVFYNPLNYGLIANHTGGVAITYNELFAVKSTTNVSSFGLTVGSNNANKTLTNCFAMDLNMSGLNLGSPGTIFNNCHAVSCNKGNSTSRSGIQINTFNAQLKNSSSNANLNANIYLNGNAYNTVSDSSFGTMGTSTRDVYCAGAAFINTLFTNCNFGSATLISFYDLASAGSEIKFHKYNQTENYHFWYNVMGKNEATGTGLPDTTVRTASSLAVAHTALAVATPQVYEYNVLAKAGNAVSALGFLRRDTTFGAGGTILVELFLPGSSVADTSYTMPTTIDTWFPYVLGATYSGTVDGYATVRVTMTTAGAGGKVYHDDIYNGTNKITAFDVWYQGKPSEIMFEQLGDANAVWSVVASTQTTSGTMGKIMNKVLTLGKFIALK